VLIEQLHLRRSAELEHDIRQAAWNLGRMQEEGAQRGIPALTHLNSGLDFGQRLEKAASVELLRAPGRFKNLNACMAHAA